MAQSGYQDDDDATAWAVRTGDPAFDDWEEFTAWLEADASRSGRYDAVVAAVVDAAAAAASAPRVALSEAPSRPSRRVPLRWIGGGLAAVLSVGLFGTWLSDGRSQPYVVQTAAGTSRLVRLADGSSITLGGASSVILDAAEPRLATLERGQALFAVRHDEGHPFEVKVGETRMIDLGTRFEVKRTAELIRVAVAEGAVLYDPAAAAVHLDPGQALVDHAGVVRRERVDPAAVGAWRSGILSYDGAGLEEVASDLDRLLGHPVFVAPGLEKRSVRGTVDTGAVRQDPTLLGAMLGVRVVTMQNGWRLEPAQ